MQASWATQLSLNGLRCFVAPAPSTRPHPCIDPPSSEADHVEQDISGPTRDASCPQQIQLVVHAFISTWACGPSPSVGHAGHLGGGTSLLLAWRPTTHRHHIQSGPSNTCQLAKASAGQPLSLHGRAPQTCNGGEQHTSQGMTGSEPERANASNWREIA
jgi:hypothetical protein